MKYVGATDWFIRWPFVVEGTLIGLIGALVPSIICWFGYGMVVTRLSRVPILDFLVFQTRTEVFLYLFPFALALGTIIGLAGSLISIRRHLNV